ncbi:rhomboid family intramembrane serine protease [Baekduia soli]|uniref:Rhomboid family intramembrane serine protease n=2 Tax=Baekduia soli TaxID=496014 RepID=A0A5B8UA38_9ACTN|nr:rhomboid family intramembrane serine protease [Baekduia soli]
MTPTSVGMRCPECAKQKTKVHRGPAVLGDEPRVTIAIIVVCVIVFLAQGSFGARESGGSIYEHFALFGPYVDRGDYWRLVTSGFLHSGIFHIGFNMYLLWVLGQQLERVIGSVRFGVLYFTALLCGSFGALVQTTESGVVGASGAVFGLMGVLAIEQRRRGYDPFSGGLGGLILINLVIGFIPGLNIAFGGHIGGLVGGLLAAVGFTVADRMRRPWIGYAGCLALAAIAVAGAIAVSGNLHSYSL